MNNRGAVLGSDTSGNAFKYENGHKVKISVTLPANMPNSCAALGPLLAPPIPEAINDRGDVVLGLYVQTFFYPIANCLVLLRERTLTLLPENGVLYAIALNNRDQVIGDDYGPTMFHPIFGFGANCTRFPHSDDTYQAYGINNRGDVVGTLHSDALGTRAALCNEGTWFELGGDGSEANSINDRGLIVGHATTTGGDQHAVLYKDGKTIDLGTLSNQTGSNSDAQDINNEGEIIGWSDTDWQHPPEPVVWIGRKKYSLQGLIDPRDKLSGRVTLLASSMYIDDKSLVAIEGVDSRTNDTHVYLMTPIHECERTP